MNNCTGPVTVAVTQGSECAASPVSSENTAAVAAAVGTLASISFGSLYAFHYNMETTESLRYLGSLPGHKGWVTAIATSSENPDMILTASRGTRIT